MTKSVGDDEASDDLIALQEAQRDLRDMQAENLKLRAVVKNMEAALRVAGNTLEPYFRRLGPR